MLRLEIVTPEAKTYSDDVDSVVIPGIDGELGVLPLHAPLMTQLEPGELRVLKGGQELRLAVGEGFVEITPEKVAVLTDMAVKESDIDESAAEEAIRRAEQAMSGEKLTNEEYAANNAALLRSLALIKVKRRRHHV
ncbi:MAG: ATP synthase F1 subunit epsilon [Verrucomicrobia bacterium]|jgi:F-type H+-transporting ATPase subunit epsilon|nr:ATP synthase F1 subunit epsilon [Verrucomicrobiota bacterium]